jgi:hypothetical protein
MVEMSVLLGIKSHGQEIGHKKRARMPRVPLTIKRQVTLARGWSLDQIPQPRKGLKSPINRHFFRLRPSVFGATSPPSSKAAWGEGWPAEPKLWSSEAWRPGLDLNQDKERCIAPASTLSATGPIRSSPILRQAATLAAH